MSRRSLLVLAAFAGSLLVVLGAVAWLSAVVLRLERAEGAARREANLEEGVRLSLWRMDSAVAPLLAREGARPYFAYSAFTPAEGVYTRMFQPVDPGDILVASPLLVETPPEVLLHFQIGPDGSLTSPQVPGQDLRPLAEREVPAARLDEAERRLARLARLAPPARILAAAPAGPGARPDARQVEAATAKLEVDQAGEAGQLPGAQAAAAPQLGSLTNAWGLSDQSARNSIEYSKRAQNVGITSLRLRGQVKAGRDGARAPVVEGPITAVWIAPEAGSAASADRSPDGAGRDDAPPAGPIGELVLLRRVTVGGSEYLQGCWLDWERLRAGLLAEVLDILPQARLVPLGAGALVGEERRLAALPVGLVPGAILAPLGGGGAPMRLVLPFAWSGVLLAALAIGGLLAGVLALGERRADFVSAVTHELRTPLTTLRTYTEMLAEGRITDEDKRARYLGTLRREAERLVHLVENVLLFSRVERGVRARREVVTIADLVERARERLEERAARSEMTLALEVAGDAGAARVEGDPGGLEQILFNLVDNACKYAASAEDRRIHVRAALEAGGRDVVVRVSDHGPGVTAGDRRRLFRPFARSAERAAGSAPGVGLGLALCRRLARSMRGALVLEPAPPAGGGASFALRLPARAPERGPPSAPPGA